MTEKHDTQALRAAALDTLRRVYEADNGRYNRTRVRIWYGDLETGRSWHDENYVTGYLGRSTGSQPVFLLLARRTSSGGPPILESCIVRIDVDGETRFAHPTFWGGYWTVGRTLDARVSRDFPWEVRVDNAPHARFKTEKKAARFFDFMTCRRATK